MGIDPDKRMVHFLVKTDGVEKKRSFSLTPQIEGALMILRGMVGI